MMRVWLVVLLVACCFQTSLFANDKQAIAVGLRMVAKGELSDPIVIAGIEKVFQTDSDENAKVQAAYLMTYVETDEPESLLPYLDYLLGSEKTQTLLGQDGVLRVARLKADISYERAKFDDAISAYGKIAELTDGAKREYAILKWGWCHLNKQEAAKAFQHWLNYLREPQSKEREISPNVYFGLGQAFTENLKRTESDVLAISQLSLTDEQRLSVASGMKAGIFFLNTNPLLIKWISQVATLPWQTELADLVLSSDWKDRRACQMLTLLEASPERKLKYEDYASNFAICAAYMTKRNRKKAPVNLNMNALVVRMERKNQDHEKVFDYFWAVKDSNRACDEGLAWLSDWNPEKELNAPVKKIASSCLKSIDKNVVLRTKTLQWVNELSSREAFRSESDPRLFVASTAIENKDFLNALAVQMLASDELYRATLLPVLVSDKLLEQGSGAQAYAMRDKFKEGAKTEIAKQVWSQAVLVHLTEQMKAKDFAGARKTIEENWMKTQGWQNSLSAKQLWVKLVLQSKSDSSANGWVLESVNRLLETNALSKNRTLLAGMLEVAADRAQWDALWAGLVAYQGKRKLVSEKLEVELFEAALQGFWKPTGVDKLKDKQLRSILQVASSLAKGDSTVFTKVSLRARSPLSRDIRYLKSLSRRKANALRKRAALEQFSRWVNLLTHINTKFKKRKWATPKLYLQGLLVVGGFCDEATGRLSTMKRPEELGAEDWKTLTGSIQTKVGQCQTWVKQQQQSSQEKKV